MEENNDHSMSPQLEVPKFKSPLTKVVDNEYRWLPYAENQKKIQRMLLTFLDKAVERALNTLPLYQDQEQKRKLVRVFEQRSQSPSILERFWKMDKAVVEEMKQTTEFKLLTVRAHLTDEMEYVQNLVQLDSVLQQFTAEIDAALAEKPELAQTFHEQLVFELANAFAELSRESKAERLGAEGANVHIFPSNKK